MTMLTNGDPVPVTPKDQADRPEDARIVYYVTPPTLKTWAEFRRALKREGAQIHTDGAIVNALEAAVQAALDDPADPDRQEAERLIALRRAEIDGGDKLSDDDRGRLVRLVELVARAVPDFADKLAAQDHFWDIAAIEAPRLFLAGWDNRAETFRRGLRGVPLDLLEAIPDAHRQAVTAKVLALRAPTGQEEGNSPSPSPGRSEATTSPGTSTPTPDGPSAGSTSETAEMAAAESEEAAD